MMISPGDTIVVNDSVLTAFKHSRGFDYARDLEPGSKPDYFDRLWQELVDLLDFNDSVYSLNNVPDWGWWCMGALGVLAVGYLFMKNRVKLFAHSEVEFPEQEVSEENINELDLDQLIAQAEAQGDYLMQCRLRYLQALKAASDASVVTWRRYKTPTQYAMEWQDEDFAVMTHHFLRIRYGHYTATAALAQEMRSRQQAVQERLASIAAQPEPAAPQPQEGGGQP